VRYWERMRGARRHLPRLTYLLRAVKIVFRVTRYSIPLLDRWLESISSNCRAATFGSGHLGAARRTRPMTADVDSSTVVVRPGGGPVPQHELARSGRALGREDSVWPGGMAVVLHG